MAGPCSVQALGNSSGAPAPCTNHESAQCSAVICELHAVGGHQLPLPRENTKTYRNRNLTVKVGLPGPHSVRPSARAPFRYQQYTVAYPSCTGQAMYSSIVALARQCTSAFSLFAALCCIHCSAVYIRFVAAFQSDRAVTVIASVTP